MGIGTTQSIPKKDQIDAFISCRTLSLAKGQFTCILGSDDYYLPSKIEENVRFLQHNPHMGVIHSDGYIIADNGTVQSRWMSLNGNASSPSIFERLLKNNFVMLCSSCCRTELLHKYVDFNKYALRGYLTEDYPMWLDLASRTLFGYIHNPLACFRVVQGSGSHPVDELKKYLFWKSVLRIKLDYAQEYDAPNEIKKQIIQRYYEHLFKGGHAFFLKDDYMRGYHWFLANTPEACKQLVNRIRILSVRSEMLWRIVVMVRKLLCGIMKCSDT